MIINQDGKRLVQAAVCHVVDKDDYSVIIEARGLNDKGDVTVFRIAISMNEIDVLMRYAH